MPQDDKSKPAVLITGSTKRIGRTIALDFATRGWQVAIHYRRSEDDALNVAREIDGLGGRAVTVKADLTHHQEVEDLVPAALEGMGRLDCLINNASLFEKDEIGSIDAESWYAHLDVNLKVPVFLAQAFAEALPDDRQGNVVNIIDQRVWRLNPVFFSYTVSKAALWAATQMLAQALAPRIRVNGIGPGPVLQSVHQSPEQFERQEKSTILGRGTTPQQIADAIQFLLSSPAITGQMIALDGGQHLSWKTPDILGVEK